MSEDNNNNNMLERKCLVGTCECAFVNEGRQS